MTKAGLAEILALALTSPNTLGPDSIEGLADALLFDPNHGELLDVALGAIAALLYSRPDLVTPRLIVLIIDVLATTDLPDEIGRSAAKLVEYLATTEVASRAWPRVRDILLDESVDGRSRGRLLAVVRAFVEWREAPVTLEECLAL